MTKEEPFWGPALAPLKSAEAAKALFWLGGVALPAAIFLIWLLFVR
jgi:hypothetical protein